MGTQTKQRMSQQHHGYIGARPTTAATFFTEGLLVHETKHTGDKVRNETKRRRLGRKEHTRRIVVQPTNNYNVGEHYTLHVGQRCRRVAGTERFRVRRCIAAASVGVLPCSCSV